MSLQRGCDNLSRFRAPSRPLLSKTPGRPGLPVDNLRKPSQLWGLMASRKNRPGRFFRCMRSFEGSCGQAVLLRYHPCAVPLPPPRRCPVVAVRRTVPRVVRPFHRGCFLGGFAPAAPVCQSGLSVSQVRRLGRSISQHRRSTRAVIATGDAAIPLHVLLISLSSAAEITRPALPSPKASNASGKACCATSTHCRSARSSERRR
jgi:hypothetical protein